MDDGIYQNHESLRRFLNSLVFDLLLLGNTALPGAYRQAGDDLASHSQAGRPSESNNKELGMMKSDRKGIAPLHV